MLFARELGLALFDYIRACLHAVHRNAKIAITDKEDEEAITDSETFGCTETWDNTGFCKDKFISDSIKAIGTAETEKNST